MESLRSFFIILCSICLLTSLTASITDSEMDPSALVGDCVNAITGNYVINQEDILVKGTQPISIKRTHASPIHAGNMYKTSGGWKWIEYTRAKLQKAGNEDRLYIQEPNGTMLSFRSAGGNFKKHPVRFNPAPDTLEGYCNTSRGAISGQHDLSNYYVATKGELEGFDLLCPDGSKRVFKFIGPDGQGGHIFLLEKEIHPNGNKTHYEYLVPLKKSVESAKTAQFYHHTNALKRIWTSNPSENKKYAEVVIEYPGDRDVLRNFRVMTSDGQNVFYRLTGLHKLSKSFWKQLNKARMYLLTEVSHSHLPKENILYRTSKKLIDPLISERALPCSRGQKIFYYDKPKENILPFTSPKMRDLKTIKLTGEKDHRLCRVKQIDAPEAEGWRATHVFVHHPSEMTQGDGICEVFDAYDNLTRYTYSKDKRLKSIEQYSGRNELLAKTSFKWKGHRLISQSLMGGNKLCFSRFYTYDNNGNIIEEHFAGDIEGTGKLTQSTITREYSQDGRNLLVKETNPLGLVTTFQYKPDTNLPSLKLEQGKGFCRRTAYIYNDDNLLIEKSIDNGSSDNSCDLSGVTQRRITRFILNDRGSFLGFPIAIEELYFDPSTQTEIKLHKTIIEYNTQGCVEKKSVYDAMGNLSHVLEFEYDSKGRLRREKDALDRWSSYTYDANHNRIVTDEFGGNQIKIQYDKRNRPISTSVQTPGGEVHTTFARYDESSNAISNTDYLGRITSFEYDALGRVIATQLPPYYKDVNNIASPYENRKYDAAGNIIYIEDSDGQSVKTTYNALNQPTEVIKGNNTEKFSYYPSGLLKTHTQANGLILSYEYDELGRKTYVKSISSNGDVLRQEQWVYNAFHLTKHIDLEGYVTSYKYDSAGRKIETEREGHKTSYAYDAMGRQHKITYHNYENTLVEIKEFDLLGRVIEEHSKDLLGKILKKRRYAYDRNGNQSVIYRYVGNCGETEEKFVYDGFGKLTLHVDQEGYATKTSYESIHDQELGIDLEKQVITDPNGIQTVKVFHSFGDVYETSRIANGQEIAYERYYRLKSGPITKQISTIYNPDNTSRKVETRWEYDCQLRPVTQIEAVNTDLQRITLKSYTPSGQLLCLYKPDGVQIHHSYDDLDRLINLESSDGSVHYSCTYNKNDQLTQAVDILTGQETIRKWDAHGNLIYEKLGNGLELASLYDQQNRRTSLRYPDGQTVNYTYDPLFMRSVELDDFKHNYDEYDLDGNLLKQSLGYDLGNVSYEVDKLGRTKAIKHGLFSHEIKQFDSVGNVKDAELRFEGNIYAQKYDYDDHYHITEEVSALPDQYVYDSHHNRLASNDGDYEIDQLNQVFSSPKEEFSYDSNGNPTKRGQTTYKYDALDRLIEVTDKSGTHTYSYDYQHRRVQSNDPCGLRKYIFDGQNEIGSVAQNGNSVDRRILGVGQGAEIGAAVLIENRDSQNIPLHDLYGNLIVLLDDQSNLVYAAYDSFGKSNRASTDYPWGYSSKRIDLTGLVFFGRRYYDPELGRFFTPDPLGLSEGPNLYQYLQGNPLIGFDEYGLSPIITGMHTIDPIKMHASASMCADVSSAGKSLWAWDRSIFEDNKQSSYDCYSAYIQQIFPLDLSNTKTRNQIAFQRNLNYSVLGALVAIYAGNSLSSIFGSSASLIAIPSKEVTITTSSEFIAQHSISTTVLQSFGTKIASYLNTTQFKQSVINLSFKPKIDINHIIDRHSYNTQYRDVSKFLARMEPKDIESLILEGIEKTRAFELEYRGKMYDRVSVVNFNRTIGYDDSGNPTSFLRIIWRNKQIRTAYPIEVL
ncbi:MAG: hypothetical protein H7A39_00985 [Chlamydiales bacterium]|nr:hypothetical protein [Chlamydiales bacterium]